MESARGLEKMGLDARERIDLSNQLSDHAKALGQPEPASSERRESAAAMPTIRVGGNVQAAKLIKKVDPAYPPLAKAAHIEGTVHLSVNIDPDGHVRGLETIDGHPLLIHAAREAVEKWEYQPTFLNGAPVTVITTVDVNFTLKPQE
jgi:protein TonB